MNKLDRVLDIIEEDYQTLNVKRSKDEFLLDPNKIYAEGFLAGAYRILEELKVLSEDELAIIKEKLDEVK